MPGVRQANPAALETLGYDAEELKRVEPFQFVRIPPGAIQPT